MREYEVFDSLGKRLRNLRTLLPGNQTVKTVSSAIGISYNTLSAYERDERIPDAINLAMLADYYDTTCDYIARGLSPENIKVGKKTGFSEEALEYLDYLNRTSQPLAGFLSFFLQNEYAGDINRYIDASIKSMDEIGILSELSELYQFRAQKRFAQALERYVNYTYLRLDKKTGEQDHATKEQ